MSSSDLIRKYFSAYESKDRKTLESLLSNDFVFTSPFDYRIDRETYFKRCWPYSQQSPTYEIEKMLERDNEAFVLYDWQDLRMAADPGTRNSSLSKETRLEKSRSTSVLPQKNQHITTIRILVSLLLPTFG